VRPHETSFTSSSSRTNFPRVRMLTESRKHYSGRSAAALAIAALSGGEAAGPAAPEKETSEGASLDQQKAAPRLDASGAAGHLAPARSSDRLELRARNDARGTTTRWQSCSRRSTRS
jgi:hypothetical protein